MKENDSPSQGESGKKNVSETKEKSEEHMGDYDNPVASSNKEDDDPDAEEEKVEQEEDEQEQEEEEHEKEEEEQEIEEEDSKQESPRVAVAAMVAKKRRRAATVESNTDSPRMEFSIKSRSKKSKKDVSHMKYDYKEEFEDDVSESEGQVPSNLASADTTGSEFVLEGENNFRFYSDESEKLYEHVCTRPQWCERQLDMSQPLAK